MPICPPPSFSPSSIISCASDGSPEDRASRADSSLIFEPAFNICAESTNGAVGECAFCGFAPAANAKKFAAKNNAAGILPIFNIKNIISQIWECFQDKIKAWAALAA